MATRPLPEVDYCQRFSHAQGGGACGSCKRGWMALKEREMDGEKEGGGGRGGVVGGQASEIRMYFVKTRKTR